MNMRPIGSGSGVDYREGDGIVQRIIDGDTLVVDVWHRDAVLNFEGFVRRRVRLYGVNCPEEKTPDGKIATSYVKQWLDLTKSRVVVEVVEPCDAFGRMLAKVYDTGRVHDLCADLLESGHAKPFKGIIHSGN